MTDQQIHHRNLSIASFLGWFQREDIDGTLNPVWYKKTDHSTIVAYSEYNNYPFKDMPFHRDWKWLMDVVETIELLGYGMEINPHSVLVYNLKKAGQHTKINSIVVPVCYNINNNKLETVWNAVVHFIEWYNENKLKGNI